MRRFRPGDRTSFGSITFSVDYGSKADDDFVLRWSGVTEHPEPVPMAAVFYAVDFMAENEDRLAQHKTFWKFNGDSYFLREVQKAAIEGWRVVAERIDRQRRR